MKNDYELEVEESDDIGTMPQLAKIQSRGRRTSVSAESMKPTDASNFKKIVIEKSEEQRTRIKESVKNSFLFKNLDNEQYEDVVNAMAEHKAAAGDKVIEQGGIGDFFYIVQTGRFEALISRNNEPAVKVAEYGPGGSFGELALMYNSPRAATIQATTDGLLWALDRQTFRRILLESAFQKRQSYDEFLKNVPILQTLEPYERTKIADVLESVTFANGDTVLRQGDVGDNFYLIEEGEAKVEVQKDGKVQQYPNLQKGSYFGG